MNTNQIKTACVRMTGPDDTIDMNRNEPANELPIKCSHCTFPDLDFVPKTYLLARGFTSPSETTKAVLGNFLVRERVRRILEIAVPAECTFYPTAEFKSKKLTPWWLAVPVHKLATIRVLHKDKPVSRCSKCGELEGDWGDDWDAMTQFDSKGINVFKPTAWDGWNREIERDLYFSVRLEQLLKRVKLKGQLFRLIDFEDVKTSPADEAWIAEKLKLLAEHGLVDAPKSAASPPSVAAKKWFQQFVQKNAAKKSQSHDFAAVEKKQQFTLPADYKDFITVVGPKTFADVNGMEGATTSVLPPAELDCKNYRRSKVPELAGDEAAVDGVAFATVDSGDVFVFDVAAPGGDWPVYFYNHEENVLEPFATNFAECIRRFVKKE